MRIHITGASGTGTTTLANKVARELGCPHFDSDDYFWVPTEIPYTQKRLVEDRWRLLMADLQSSVDWILSGCKCNWQNANTDDLYDLVVFLYVPKKIRLERLEEREIDRFGKQALEHGGYFHDNHIEFMEWASLYDTKSLSIRSETLHENWLEKLNCPILRLEGNNSIDENLQSVLEFIKQKQGQKNL